MDRRCNLCITHKRSCSLSVCGIVSETFAQLVVLSHCIAVFKLQVLLSPKSVIKTGLKLPTTKKQWKTYHLKCQWTQHIWDLPLRRPTIIFSSRQGVRCVTLYSFMIRWYVCTENNSWFACCAVEPRFAGKMTVDVLTDIYIHGFALLSHQLCQSAIHFRQKLRALPDLFSRVTFTS